MSGALLRPVLFYALLYASAFALNFCWESWHGLLYDAHQQLPASVYVPMMVRMALLDAFSVIGLQLFTALFARALVWRPSLVSVMVFVLAGALAAWSVEYVSVVRLHLWTYLPGMPTLFGAGLSPVLQFPATGLAGVVVARAIAGYGRSRDERYSRTYS